MQADFIRELFADFRPVELRRMFGGAGIYADGVMFGLATRDVLYLKADVEETACFLAEGCGPFHYDTKVGKRTIRSFWRVPDRLYDDPGELAKWAQRAVTAARRRPARGKR